MPLLATAYAVALIYVTSMPLEGNVQTFSSELMSWVITLAGIGLTLFILIRFEQKWFPETRQFPLKLPKLSSLAGLMLIAPLCLTIEGYVVYGLTSIVHTVQLEPLTYTASELREDLLSSVHAVLLAPVLEELCYRHLAISPFSRRRTQILVCVLMAVLFGILHVRNIVGASLAALLFGLVFIWSRNIWYAILLHAGSNLTAALLGVYSYLCLGEIQMCKAPVISLPDGKVYVASFLLAIAGGAILFAQRSKAKRIEGEKRGEKGIKGEKRDNSLASWL
jgi:membrane protease YdiL (CAAX protease family)